MWDNSETTYRSGTKFRDPVLTVFTLRKFYPMEQKDWIFSIKEKRAILQKKAPN